MVQSERSFGRQEDSVLRIEEINIEDINLQLNLSRVCGNQTIKWIFRLHNSLKVLLLTLGLHKLLN